MMDGVFFNSREYGGGCFTFVAVHKGLQTNFEKSN